MVDDLKQFLKVYRVYKKGKRQMDKAKEWIENHKIELAVVGSFVIGYKLGFKRGCKATDRAVSRLINELDRVASKVVGR